LTTSTIRPLEKNSSTEKQVDPPKNPTNITVEEPTGKSETIKQRHQITQQKPKQLILTTQTIKQMTARRN
jgi:hypothetical protein